MEETKIWLSRKQDGIKVYKDLINWLGGDSNLKKM